MGTIHDHTPHTPVLFDETISGLVTDKDGMYLDCTVGFGGHALGILNKLNTDGKLIGIDVDPYALEYSELRLKKVKKNNFELTAVMTSKKTAKLWL